MTKTLNQIIFVFLHQNQNIFFSNIGNQNIFLEKTINDCIPSLNWNSIIFPENSMDENCQTFTKTFIEIIKNCVPQKEVTIRLNDKVWFNSELRREISYFFPEFNIRFYDKNSESDNFCFPPPKSEYFFQQHWESEYFLEKKHKQGCHRIVSNIFFWLLL
jgi:hypothetical protein